MLFKMQATEKINLIPLLKNSLKILIIFTICILVYKNRFIFSIFHKQDICFNSPPYVTKDNDRNPCLFEAETTASCDLVSDNRLSILLHTGPTSWTLMSYTKQLDDHSQLTDKQRNTKTAQRHWHLIRLH